ncbi:MAG: DUF2153 family protein [Candidatus Bathyarchaeia archaeon]
MADTFALFRLYFGNKAKLRLRESTGIEGASKGLSWTEERSKAVEDIKKLEPADRLGLYASLIRMNSALFESVRGWDSWLRNPSFIDTFTEEELKDIFKQFREVCLRFLEEDVKWTGKKEKSLPMGSKTPKVERPDSERRYA